MFSAGGRGTFGSNELNLSLAYRLLLLLRNCMV
jgi:hypothetical protein